MAEPGYTPGYNLIERKISAGGRLFSNFSFISDRFGFFRSAFLVFALFFSTCVGALAQNNLLYFISDSSDELYSIDRTDGTVTLIGSTNRTRIEAIAYYPIQGAETLYAADAGDFGTLNLSNGNFTEIGEIDGGGTADGSAGPQTLNDVDGLMLDGQTLIMWAVERQSGSTPDLLFQIDLTTGQFVPDAFGAGVDYLEITGTGINVDVDDLAVDPISGEIYGVSNDNGSGDALVRVNKTTGEFEFVTTLAQDDVEGLSFHNDGKLYGSEGDGDNRLSLINPVTGAMTNFFSFSPGGDVEGLAALVAPTNLISGTVFQDDDLDGVNDMGETGIANVTVYLYLDQDGDGNVDPEDTRIQTTTTDVNGDYSFNYITTGTLLTRTEFSTYPAGFSLTTDNVETITFTDGINFGESDTNNDFGLGTGSDCDGDGLTDFFEGTGDADGDGILNQCDLDSDNDGIRDDDEGTEDFDDDGIPNYLDRDSDDDGIPDAIEANGGIRPAEYVDLQGNLSGAVGANGIVDTRETAAESGVMLAPNPDSDGDGYLDYLDLDSDNDGILDLREAGGTVDVDGDGQVDGLTDANGNGYDDTLETSPFAVPNTDVAYENTNGQTRRPNYIDIDSDADGIDDTREGLSTVGYRFPTIFGDIDQDGILDFWDISDGSNPIVPVDTDSDGTPDYTDTNSDNDAESDFIEGNDADNNGTADQTNTGLDANGNGLDDRFDAACVNTTSVVATDHAEENNGTGSVNLGSSDIELINDGGTAQTVGVYFPSVGIDPATAIQAAYIQFQADEVQTGSITITIQAELSTAAALFSGTTNDVTDRLTPGTTATEAWSPANWNTIGEATTTQQTVDITSIIQELIGQGGWSASSPMVFLFTGPNGNRRTAEVNPTLVIQTGALACSSSVSLPDTDTDDEFDFRDFEGVALDTDGDGVPDATDIDDDNDGILDVDESEVIDTDGDGIPNSLDLDSDNDGIEDIIEAGGVDTDNDGRVDVATDTDGDGWADTFDSDNGGTALTNPDTDGDGFQNFLDLDSDGDGVVDLIESQATTGTPIIPTGSDADGDGIDNAFDVTGGTPITPVDTETDGTPDYLDLDSDNDGLSDLLEAHDTDGDGTANVTATGSDLDQDGLDNAFDNVVGPNSTTNVYNNEDALDFPDVVTAGLTSERDWREDNGDDTDGDGQVNSLDIDDDDDGILDVNEGNGDFDNDGIINSLDLDSDNDGIPDIIEAGGVDSNNDGRVDDNTDTDNDGWADTFDSDNGGTALAEADTDSDGLKNYADVDSDGDGIVDLIESQATTGSPNTPSGTDTDLDGLDNTFDTNNGGTPTTPVDTDADLIPDYIDANSDNDGFADILEAWDTDGDLTANVLPSGTDTDNDGLDDAFDDVVGPNGTTNATNNETALSFPDVTTTGNSERDWREVNAADSDFDGIPDNTDIDDDNDGILDVDENCGPTSAAPVNAVSSANIINAGDVSFVNDGLFGTDDGAGFNTVGHYVVIDLGSDIPSGTDITFTLWRNNNTDNKTLRFAQLSNATFDAGMGTNAQTVTQASIENATVSSFIYTLDADTRYVQVEMTVRDGGRIELIEATLGSYFLCTQDTDGDGIVDALDLDSDNDGIPDIIEAGGVDTNNDGRVDNDTDTDNDGWANTFDADNGGVALINSDSDNDGIKNFLDLDSDNDGIEDIIEAGGVDSNDDGVVDSATDADGDGWANTFDSDNGGTALTVPDTDADGLENYIDIDADGDGIVDLIESQATTGSPIIPVGTDTDGDGIDNAFDSDNAGTPITPVDTELDGTPDYIDVNSDNDSFSDQLEGYDTNNDQVANTLPAGLDSDGDGLDDNFDNVVGPNATNNPYNDQDANDFPDVSTSGLTSERDWREANTLDADFDGVDDATDIDDDNDGILDVTEGTGDADGDGIPNNLDLDSDNDGIPDIIEAGGVDTDNDGRVDTFVDGDGDGWANTFDSDNGGTALAEPDSDNDGVKNYVDLDSDNDGILDITEVGNADTNGDGRLDSFLDANGDGYDDNIASGILILPNSDQSYENTNGLPNLPNYIDIDSDADGIDDTREGYSTAGYQEPVTFTDSDGDGILDFWDVNSGNSPIDPVDTDGAGLDDYVDENSDNDSRSDFIEGNDFNEDGVADVPNTGQDTNGNGLDDAFDQDCYGNTLSSVANSYGEQQGTSVNISSSDLELVTDGVNNQVVGMYFPNIAINQSETINSAYIQFQVDETDAGAVSLTIEGQLAANPAVFTTGTNNVSTRSRTSASAAWSPPDWNSTGEAGTDQRTVDISSIIQEIVNQGGWSNGNPLVIIITGPSDTDTRTAENNPTLVINFGSGITFCSSNVALQDGDLDGEKDWRDSNGLEAPADKDADGVPDIDDVDDDNDGILDTAEGCTDTAVSGANASSATQTIATVSNTANSIDGANGTFAAFTNDGAQMEVELRSGSIVTAGTDITIRAQKTDNVASTMTVQESTDGISYVNSIEFSFATDDVYENLTYTLATNATHIRITYNEVTGDLRVDNVSYPAFTVVCTGTDTDSDGIPDHLDIDADGDGIVDLIESQATTGTPVIPVGVDTDGDGLDDAFDSDCAPCGIVTGVPTVLADTDGDLTFDFLDFNSDNDTFSDQLEGWDTDGNLVANLVPTGTDADNDGLDDGFDLVNGINGTTNVYNTQDAFDFPDQTTQGNTERDWREQNVADTDLDGIQDSNDIDDDNDGILDQDEGCIDGPQAVVAGVEFNGGGQSAAQNSFVNDGAATADQGIIFNLVGEVTIIDLGYDVPSGVTINFDLWESNNNGKELRFAQLPDATQNIGGGTNLVTITDATITGVTTLAYTLNATTRYVQIDMTERPAGGRLELVEATIQAYDFGCSIDTDGDGVFDAFDLDSDNDGIPDIIEAGGVDVNNDGRVDDNTDTDTDGWANTFDSDNGGTALTNPDTDTDGVLDTRDRDSDNDGIEDIIEAGGVDSDNDGEVDSFTDLDGDGWDNTFDSDNGGTVLPNPDTDGDGLRNNVDIDADGDGIVDLIESQATTGSPVIPGGTDSDSDGIDNAFDVTGGTPTDPVDTDADGTPDYIDFNSDNDSFLDAQEGYDTDGDLVENISAAGTDTDGDGLDDNYDTVVGPNSTTNVYNNEDANDFPDVTTSAQTSERDWREANTLDTDSDGVPDATDIDDDNDGVLDVDESEVLDFDNDGIVNSLDLDSDNDGIPDIIEAGGVDTDNDGKVDNNTDTDGDGWANTFDSDNGGTALTDPDTDADEQENRIDVDSDDDGIVDLIESQATTGSPVVPGGSDLDGDGIDDAFDVDCTPCGGVTGVPTSIVNTDGTDNPDYIDTDSDNDGLNDIIEAYDTDGDYLADETPNGNDDDNDGLDDNFDNIVGPNSTTNATNSQTANTFPDVTTSAVTSERDWRESNAENCQPGGINSNFLLWLRADDGGTSWRDVSNNYVSVSSIGAFTTGNNINFNPSNFFNGSAYYNTSLSINADTYPDLAVIVVYQPTIDNSGAVWGEDNGSFDRYILDDNGVGENEAVSNGTGLTSNVSGLYSVGTTTISSVLFDEDQASGSTVYINGSDTQTNFTSDHGGETSNNLQIGGLGDATNRFNGTVSEVIVYNSLLTSGTDFQQIQSYLAIKYGVTLSSDTDGDASAFEAGEGDYIASNGSTLFWDASNNTGFHNNVAGIARDDASCLNQLQSQSGNSDAIVAIGLDAAGNGLEASNSQNPSTFGADFSALMWGHDGAPLYDSDNTEFSPLQVDSRLNREWRVRETNTVGQVTVRFDVSNLLGPSGVGTNDEAQIVLLLDANGDFSESAQVVLQSNVTASDGFVEFLVDFSDGIYFTLASTEQYALPITLLSFEGQSREHDVLLRWSTADETNNSLFRIERSGNGIDFETIGYRDGAGTTTSITSYSFIDEQPLEGENFYRLIDIDNNGDENSSEIIRLLFYAEAFEPMPYPNPVQVGQQFYIDTPGRVNIGEVKLYQLNGVEVPVVVEEAGRRLAIRTHQAQHGVYILNAVLNGERYRFKLFFTK